MEINEKNQCLYHKAFIQDGSFQVSNNWKPSINESEIDCVCRQDDGTVIPATPLGFRDYLTSRLEGISNILDQEPDITMTIDELKNCKKGEEPFKVYDHIYVSDRDEHFVIVGYWNEPTELYLLDKDNRLRFVNISVTEKFYV